MATITGIAGLAGAILLCAAYFAAVRHWLAPLGRAFALLSGAGALLVLPWLLTRPEPLLTAVLLAAIAFLALAHLLRARRGD